MWREADDSPRRRCERDARAGIVVDDDLFRGDRRYADGTCGDGAKCDANDCAHNRPRKPTK
jgi:hypothetical protein